MEQMETIGDYWSQRSQGFSEYVFEHLDEDLDSLYLRIINKNVEGKRLRILDIGCGPGLFSVVLGKEGHEVVAIDYSEGVLDKARENCKRFAIKSDIRKMDAQKLEFNDESFDLIVSRKVIWNLPDPVRAYKEWIRVLKKGGKMFLFDGNYFLGMYDKDYHHDVPFKNESEKPQMYQGADPRILTDFAKDLPLSKERRPSWDVSTLIKLGIKHVEVDIDTSIEHVESDGNVVQLPQTFILTVHKE